ncbi:MULTISPECIES: hypothetical protein [unclassified Streptomyces]|uniref:hypothetical protein n=1 Tax=unclassified Streptomyces TaxID=2593676 RepID=UPI00116115FB|nr:hypothetical protein [Streptomyces sp. TSRI0281]
MRYPQGGRLTAERQQFREELRLQAGIVVLDHAGLPSAGFRGHPGRAPGPWNPTAEHTYLAVRAPDTPAGWTYEYAKADTAPTED